MKSTLQRLLTVLILLTSLTEGFAQQAYLITGIIKDQKTGESIPGITVSVKSTIIGTASNSDGSFSLKTNKNFPFTLVISGIGYTTQELEVNDASASLLVALQSQQVLVNEVVVSASRIAESQLNSPVSIEKLDIRAIQETPAVNFFDALENIKGVQMTTLSLGYKVPNTRGFSNATNSRFLQLVDGVDVTSPGIGAPVANAVGPTELDVQSVELIPGAASALYGLNAVNGIASIKTKDPFIHKGLGVYQKTGVNHVNDQLSDPKLYSETALRYANTLGNRFAYKVNVGYTKGYDWIASDYRDLNPNANAKLGLTGENNPGKDPINAYGTESSNRKDIKLADGKTYTIARTGYQEKDIADYNVENLKGDAALYYKLNDNNQLSYSYRIGKADNIYQRGNRIKLDDLIIQQHKVELQGTNYFFRAYRTEESTNKSYNLRPLGENLDRSFKKDDVWFKDYTTAFEKAYNEGKSVNAAQNLARAEADKGRFQPGTLEFDAKKKELVAINNWDKGAALIFNSSYSHTEGQYDFSRYTKGVETLIGFDVRQYNVKPDGNSFINPEGATDAAKLLDKFDYSKGGGFVQLTKKLFNEKIKLVGSLRVDKQQYFKPTFNPRIATVINPSGNHRIRLSYQNGYRFPTLFEGFSYVDNGGVKRLGGLEVLVGPLKIIDNSYVRASQDAFNTAVKNDVNKGSTEAEAIEKNKGLLQKSNYGYIKPEHLNSFEIGYKTIALDNRLFVDADFYYNRYENFIGQVEIARINKGQIGVDDSTVYYARTSSKYANNTRFRLWTNSTSVVTNIGASLGLTYNFYKSYTIGGNFNYAALQTVSSKDVLIPAFNTPKYTVNASFGNRELFDNFGFNITYHWQDNFYYNSQLADGRVPAYQTLDAQVNYRLLKEKLTVKVGASNLVNNYYTQYIGGPSVGGLYYVSLALDGLLTK